MKIDFHHACEEHEPRDPTPRDEDGPPRPMRRVPLEEPPGLDALIDDQIHGIK